MENARAVSHAAVITAGGRVDGEFARAIGTPVKALAPLGGSTFLHRTIAALRGIGVERIAVVGGDEVRAACSATVERVIGEHSSGAENLRRALHAWDQDTSLLYLTSDMPFIDAASLRAFLDAAPPQTIALPLTEWPDFTRRFPAAPPFGITLCGERVVNGGAFLIPAHAHARIESFAMRFFDARKSPLAMARLTGPALLLQFVFKRLSIAKLEQHATRLLGVPARAVRGAPPELAYDVDVLEEYRYAVAHA
jgi:GTP:adenosylcobinamide-phosphate guanylyltransferase